VAHCETVCRSFYAYHLEAGTGPIVNPFPLARAGRAHAHHNPLDPFPRRKSGLFRPRVPKTVPRQIPDSVFNELFAGLGSNRDRALVAFWVSTGARASELLGVTRSGADPGQQLITVIRKGSRAIQALPASPDAFVWLRLYQQEVHGLVPARADDPLWWTLRRPFRPLAYNAARMMFDRANAAIGSGWSLHSLRPTGSPVIPACRSPTCNGYSATPP
jgi:integrase